VERKDIPVGSNILRSKFVFDLKRGPNREFLKFKARFVAVGTTQIEGVDFVETFASVMTTKSFRILLSLWNNYPEFGFEHWDVKNAFVNAPLSEIIYVRQADGYEKEGQENKILKLRKALYGTKQAAHAWQQYLFSIFRECGGKRSLKDECVYMWREGDAVMFVCTHVDDIFPLFNPEGRMLRDKIINTLTQRMEIENRGEISFALDRVFSNSHSSKNLTCT